METIREFDMVIVGGGFWGAAMILAVMTRCLLG